MTDAPANKVKKPSLLSQIIPYLFSAVILVFVFTGLSNPVVDEPHRLMGRDWSGLARRGVKNGSIKLTAPDNTTAYCSRRDAEKAKAGCPPGGDFEVREESGDTAAAIRRTEGSRIPDGGEVQADYAQKIKPGEVLAMARHADLRWFLPLIILHVFIFALGDTMSFGLAYRFFNAPGMTFKEMLECRMAPYVIQVGLAPLAEVLFPLYMWRVKKAPITEVVSSNLLCIVLDFCATFTFLTAALAAGLESSFLPAAIAIPWLIIAAIFWAGIIAAAVILNTRLRDRALAFVAARKKTGEAPSQTGASGLLRTFLIVRWHHAVRIYLVRLTIGASAILSNYAILRALGVEINLIILAIAVPITVITVFLPVSVGGYGGAQLIFWFLIFQVGKAGTTDQVLAASFLWSTGFLVGRALIGLAFIRGFWKRTFPEGFNLS